MPAPDITLPQFYILLTQVASSIGITPRQGIGIGYVELAYTTSDRVLAGQTVFFETAKASQFIYGSTIYLLVKDEFITGQENTPP